MIKKQILLVEDEVIIAFSLKSRLEKEYNYNVTICDSGEKALDKVNIYTDLVLMDISLGSGMDGIETSKKILEIVKLPIIFVSNRMDNETMSKIESFSYGYVNKNSDLIILNSAIKIALKLFDSMQKTDDVFNYSINGICIFKAIYDNVGGKVIDCEYLKLNKAYENLFNLTQDVVGKTIKETREGESQILDFISFVENVLYTQKAKSIECKLERNEQWYNLLCFPTRNHSQFAVIAENITERKLSLI